MNERGPIEALHPGPRLGAFLMRLKVVYVPSDEGGYTVSVPSLPGCVSEGNTLQEARENIREAIELYLEPTEAPPVPEGGTVEELAV